MPAKKSELKIIVEANGKRFSLNCQRCLHKKYSVKVGRSKSTKIPLSTKTEIMSLISKWVTKQEKAAGF
jgi:hypothetical protein